MSSATQPLGLGRAGSTTLARDYAELLKLRVTALIMMTAWCGYYFGALRSGVSSLSWTLLHTVLGIGIMSAGTAAMNEVMERKLDARMRRTAMRPLVTGSLSVRHGVIAASLLLLAGSVYLWLACNWLTSALTILTSLVYLLAYTPLKTVGPICTFIGAFPGAMPGVLGWTAIRGHVEWEALVLFGILFFWQFPHFHSIALLYREDYERAGIRMLPVVEADGRSTANAIMLYGASLIPMSFAPALIGMSGKIYLVGAAVLGLGLFYFCARIWREQLPGRSPHAKKLARQLLQATVIYLPLLFAFMMTNSR